MPALLNIMLMLMVSIPAGATPPSGQDPRLIVPGQWIGPARLGMTVAAIDEFNRHALCPVVATYDASGRAVWLETRWGGRCLISDRIQVGLSLGPVLRAFGKPDRVAEEEDVRYPHALAYWVVYQHRGVGFRVLARFSDAIIQTIAVFDRCGFYPKSNVDCDNKFHSLFTTHHLEPWTAKGGCFQCGFY
jgi:hypothetical protein